MRFLSCEYDYLTPQLTAVTVLVAFFLVASVRVAATVGFKSPVSYPVGAAPGAIATGDLNHDGKLDLAVANEGSGDVSILLGRGDGTFRAAVNYPVGTNPVSIALIDLNLDNRVDLVVAFQGDVNTGQLGGLSVLLGNGDGTFQPATMLSTDSFPTGLSVGDFNDDARPDLAVSGYGAAGDGFSMVGVFIGNGDGTFQPRTDYSISYCPDGGCLSNDANSIVTGDFNRDSKQDLAVTTTVFRCDQMFPEVLCGNTNVLLGNGDGTFQPVAVITVLGGAASSGAIADFDGDQGPDLVITFRPNVMAPAQVATILGNGDGTFQPPRTLSIASFATTGDLDEDGKADLLTLSTFGPSPYVQIFPGNGDGTFQTGKQFLMSKGSSITMGDFNGDKFNDLAVTLPSGNSVAILLNNSRSSGADIATSMLINGDLGLGQVVNINNRGPNAATGVTLTDTLPAGMTLHSVTPSQGTCSGSNVVVCNFGDLASGGVAFLTGTISASSSGTFALSASAVANEFDSDSSNNIATQSMTLSSLSVNKSGTGSGVVTDISGAIDCGSVCSAILLSSQPESLTAFPDAGSTFIGWTGGGCSGTGQCNITLTPNQTVTAIFDFAAPDFALSASAPTPATVSPGHSSTSTIELTASGGFNSSVALTCSVSPNPSLTPQCSINPNSAIPGTPATLTVTTTGPQAGLAATSDSGLGTALSIPLSALVLFGIVLGRRQERSRVLKTLSFAAFMAVLSFLPSCGGSSREHGTPGTPSGSYTITVMGTSGSTNHSTILTVIVQ